MYVHQQRLGSEEVQELRREGGRFLKDLREKQGLSQRQLAALVGAEYYTFISQLETGRGRVPRTGTGSGPMPWEWMRKTS